MEKYSGMGYPAVAIEHDFEIFLQKQIGGRGQHYDADFFRAGDRKQIGKAIEDVATKLESRINTIKFSALETKDGGEKARLDVVINSIRGIAADMIQSKKNEPYDYHWILVAELILALDSILTHFGF